MTCPILPDAGADAKPATPGPRNRIPASLSPPRRGSGAAVLDLDASDFEAVRGDLARGVGPVRLAGAIQMTRMVFKYAYDAGLIDRAIRYGPTFKRPSTT